MDQIKEIKIPVRDFAQPARRSGSLDAFSGFGFSQEIGSELHRLIQNRSLKEIESYQKEVHVSHDFEKGPYKFIVSGRIDGLIDKPSRPIIEEIKATFSLEGLKEVLEKSGGEHPYLLQVKTYAYLYHLKHKKNPTV